MTMVTTRNVFAVYFPREKRLCAWGVIQTEEHVICFCPLSDHVRSESPLYSLRISRSSLNVKM